MNKKIPTAADLHASFTKGDLKAEQIVAFTLKKAKENSSLGAFISLTEEYALKKAQELDLKKKNKGKLGKLAGVVIGLKDNIHIHGQSTTCASRFLENYVAPFNATVVEKIEKEDGIIIGKTNLDEFAMGSSTENSAFFPCYNPWNLSTTPGGSSGGSSAAVCAGICPISLGSDTGGSIRQPAAFTGIIGFKPTYGRVSRHGLVAFASSLDQIGPFARSVEDVALFSDVIMGGCSFDATSIKATPPSLLQQYKTAFSNKTLGVPFALLEKLEPTAKQAFEQALSFLKEMGFSFVELDIKLLDHAISLYYVLAAAEASTNLARFDGIRYGKRAPGSLTLAELVDFSRSQGFGKEVKRRILLGTFVLSAGYKEAYYKQAQKVRTLLIQEIEKAFQQCALILLPTTPNAAFSMHSIQDPLQMYLQDLYTIPANLAGLPALSMPCGLDKQGMPLGIQIMGPQQEDLRVLQLAYAMESHPFFQTKIAPHAISWESLL